MAKQDASAAKKPEQVKLVEEKEAEARKKLFAELNGSYPKKGPVGKAVVIVVYLSLTAALGVLPYIDDQLRNDGFWGHAPSKVVEALPRLYGLVLLLNVILGSLVLVVYVGCVTTGAGRRKSGFKNPVLYAAIDIYVEDVLQDGKVLSNGDTKLARAKLDRALLQNCHQRAHGNAQESYPTFVACSVVGGIVFPMSTACWGLLWSVSRIFYAQGYATGNPMGRYQNPLGAVHWFALTGVLVTATMAGFRMLL